MSVATESTLQDPLWLNCLMPLGIIGLGEEQIGGWSLMQKNDLFKCNGTIYRVVEIGTNKVLVVDCVRLTMPIWMPLREYSITTFEELLSVTHRAIPTIESLSQEQMKVMHQRFTMIAPLISFIAHDELRNVALSDMAQRHKVTKARYETIL